MPKPSLELGSPELQVRPLLEHATELGLTAADIGYITDALVDGAYAGDYWHQGDKIDLVFLVRVNILNELRTWSIYSFIHHQVIMYL
jgi:HAE1 family hydrophobic/amphiphilic exporter-1